MSDKLQDLTDEQIDIKIDELHARAYELLDMNKAIATELNTMQATLTELTRITEERNTHLKSLKQS